MSDADGNFALNVTTRKNKNLRIQLFYRLELSQRKTIIDQSNYIICKDIATFLKVSLYTRTRILNNKEFDFF
jgi:hypothetical protein